jgi:leucyl/phenylalanyl-tRNA--protein transferase
MRVDSAFDEVIAGCAAPDRPGAWIDARMLDAYRRLHRLGWAHSVEAWRDGVLAGGLYGISIGGLFAGESMFHRERDASKVALMWLVELLRAGDVERLLDVQWCTPHLASLGAVEISRDAYLVRLERALALPAPEFVRR